MSTSNISKPWHFPAIGLDALSPDVDGAGIRLAVFDGGVADVNGLESVEREGSSLDLRDHATRCASLIASKRSDAPGVAQGSQLVSVCVTDESGELSLEAVVRGFEFATRRAIHVVSCGFALEAYGPELRSAVEGFLSGGGVLVGARPNSLRRRAFPFVRDCGGAVWVGASARDGGVLGANGGDQRLDVCAPGEALAVVNREGEVDPAWHGQASGATAIVAGAIALVLGAVGHGLSGEVSRRVRESARGGVLDVPALLRSLGHEPAPSE